MNTEDMHFVVDLGKLVPVTAVNARDAYSLAVLAEFGQEPEVPMLKPIIYQLDSNGEAIEVYQ